MTKYTVIELKHIADGFRTLRETNDIDWDLKNGYIKSSVPKTIELEPLSKEVLVRQSLKALKVREDKINADTQIKLNELEAARQKLLSLTHDSEVVG